jgi:hypothetical protein
MEKKTEKKAVKKKAATKKKAAPKKKAATKKTTVKKKSTVKKTTAAKKTQSLEISPRQRYEMIATMAYFRAEHRNFEPGYDRDDWFECEQIVDKMLSEE